MKTFHLYFLLLSLVFSSCEGLITEVPAKAFKLNEEKIAVSCFISPQDTLIKALVTFSNPLYSERKELVRSFSVVNGDTTYFSESAIIENAKVVLSNPERGEEVELLYEPQYKAYVFRPQFVGDSFRIREGVYLLEVQVGQKVVTAETIVPRRRNDFFRVINDFSTPAFSFGENGSSLQVTSSLGWVYRKNENAFFRLRGMAFFETEAEVQENPVAPITVERTLSYATLFFDNFGIFDGTSITTSDSPQVSGAAIMNPAFIEDAIETGQVIVQSVHTELLTISADYFQFYDTYARNRDSNPFIEPTSVYSNIKGGIGIFAGSNGVKEVILYEQE